MYNYKEHGWHKLVSKEFRRKYGKSIGASNRLALLPMRTVQIPFAVFFLQSLKGVSFYKTNKARQGIIRGKRL